MTTHLQRHCSRCQHWDIRFPIPHAESGVTTGLCKQPDDPRDQHWKRGSDTCGGWTLKQPPVEPDPTDQIDWTSLYG
jgi:hypothetical protein